MSDDALSVDTGTPSAAPEAAPAAAPAAEPSRSVAESLAATFDAIQEREGNAPGQRGPDGKFQPRQAPVAAAPGTESTDQPVTQGNEPATPAIEAPQSWSAEMKAQFAALPPEAQKYVAQRESEAHAKISDQGNKLKAYDGIAQVIEPARQRLLAAYGSPERGIASLLELHRLATSDPQTFLRDFARGAGIDLTQLSQSAPQTPQALPADPRIAALAQHVEGLTGIFRQQALDTAQKQVDAFKADPNHKHYAAVESRIADLLDKGAARDLQDAYEQAVWGDPQVRALVIAEQNAEAKAKADAEAKRLAGEARKANVVNIRTAGGRGAPQAPSSVRASLEKAYDRANGAA